MACAKKDRLRVAPFQYGARWTVSDDDLGAGDGRGKERLDILLGKRPR